MTKDIVFAGNDLLGHKNAKNWKCFTIPPNLYTAWRSPMTEVSARFLNDSTTGDGSTFKNKKQLSGAGKCNSNSMHTHAIMMSNLKNNTRLNQH